MIKASAQKQFVVGWREWVSLPELGIHEIKAKVDTGARTSALHAFQVKEFIDQGRAKVSFLIHPLQYSEQEMVSCVADLIDKRIVTDSGGHREQRCVIKTLLNLGSMRWPIEVTLTNRDDMKFRMLLGRTALRPTLIVDPGASFLYGRLSSR